MPTRDSREGFRQHQQADSHSVGHGLRRSLRGKENVRNDGSDPRFSLLPAGLRKGISYNGCHRSDAGAPESADDEDPISSRAGRGLGASNRLIPTHGDRNRTSPSLDDTTRPGPGTARIEPVLTQEASAASRTRLKPRIVRSPVVQSGSRRRQSGARADASSAGGQSWCPLGHGSRCPAPNSLPTQDSTPVSNRETQLKDGAMCRSTGAPSKRISSNKFQNSADAIGNEKLRKCNSNARQSYRDVIISPPNKGDQGYLRARAWQVQRHDLAKVASVGIVCLRLSR